MLWKYVAVTACAITFTLALPSNHVVHEERESIPARWVKRDRVLRDAKLPMRIGLTQSNLDKVHDYLMDVSHPSSPNYGKHWTAEEVANVFQPSNETRDAVIAWLVEGGISASSIVHSDNKGWLAFHAPSHQVEALLHTTYHEYEDVNTGGVIPSCDRYHVPAGIQKHIDFIHPGVRLLAPRIDPQGKKTEKRAIGSISTRFSHQTANGAPKEPSATSLKTCDEAITPACIAALYQIPEAHTATPNNSMGLFESELQFWNQEMLNIFFSKFAPRIPNGTHPRDYDIDGGVAKTNNISQAGGEAIDLELAFPIVYPQEITIYNVDDLHYQAWPNDTYTFGFNTLLDAIDGSYCTYAAYGEKGDLPGVDPTYPDPGPGGYNGSLQCGVFKPTNVISLSYGGWEADIPISYQLRQCNEFAKLGMQGVTFIFATGDTGVGDYPGVAGGFNGPTGCLGPNHNIYNPGWPSGCPYVTAAGGTEVAKGQTVHDPETAFFISPPKHAGIFKNVNLTSGGGFSNVFPIPWYQKKAVANYLTNHNPGQKSYSKLAVDHPSNPYLLPNVTALAGNTGGVYNRAGRGHPDVSAVGANIASIYQDFYLLVDGTSASAPIFGSIINRINDERLAKGKKPVGFINPVLYEHPEILNDVTTGNNSGCFQPGFKAAAGWDPVTGLGTPNYPKMLKFWLDLP